MTNITDDLIYICSPYRPGKDTTDPLERAHELEANIKQTKMACKIVSTIGHTPIAPHLFFPQFLDDEIPKERAMGMEMALRLLCLCKQVLVVGDIISDGMASEIAEAKRLGIQIRILQFGTDNGASLLKELDEARLKIKQINMEEED